MNSTRMSPETKKTLGNAGLALWVISFAIAAIDKPLSEALNISLPLAIGSMVVLLIPALWEEEQQLFTVIGVSS